MAFVEKAKLSEEVLKEALKSSQEKSEAIKRRLDVVTKCMKDIETSSEKAVQEINNHYYNVTALLSASTTRQTTIFKEASSKQLTKFRNEEFVLDRLNQRMQDFGQSANKLLQNPGTTNFINQSKMLLSYEYSDVNYDADSSESTWKRAVYKPPSTDLAMDASQFVNFIEDHVLGHIDVETVGTDDQADLESFKSESDPHILSPSHRKRRTSSRITTDSLSSFHSPISHNTEVDGKANQANSRVSSFEFE